MNKKLRIGMAAVGAVLIVLYFACMTQVTAMEELNVGEAALSVTEGTVLEVPLSCNVEQAERVGVRILDTASAGDLAVTLTLVRGDAVLGAEVFAMAGRLPQTMVQLQAENAPVSGTTLRITAEGAGSVQLAGAGTQPYVRVAGRRQIRNLSVAYLGATLLLLTLTPFGRKEGAHA